jgi:2-polyprenyl-3-methyl-5-hydroxy-6-metoxy-1,4-benzoquinol methylase
VESDLPRKKGMARYNVRAFICPILERNDCMPDHDTINRSYWDKIIPVHQASAYYELQSFLDGNTTLKCVEEEELGDIAGKSILHLQCHMGIHTLSLERKGAHVVGVDYSSEAIKTATEIRDQAGLKAEFICANVYDLPKLLDRQFDIVFTSYGVLYCLQDLDRWARVVAHYLKKNGFFYIAELHPLFYMLDDEGKGFVYPYFHDPQGRFVESKPAVAIPGSGFQASFQEWTHSLSDVVNAVINAGLKIEFLHEFPFVVLNAARKYLEDDGRGRFRIRGCANPPPLMFSLKAQLESR